MSIKPTDMPILNMDVEMLHQEFMYVWRKVQQTQKEYTTITADLVMELFDEECEKEGLSRVRGVFESIPQLYEADWTPRMSLTRIRGMMLTKDGWFKPDYNLDEVNLAITCEIKRVNPQPDIPLEKINEILARITTQTGIKLDVRVWEITG